MDHLEHDGAQAQVEISLSVEETNALRAKLGLKPLRLAPSDTDTQAQSNFALHQAAQQSKRDAADVAKRIEKSRNRFKLRAKLAGATLADAQDGDDSAAAWAKRQKQKAAAAAKLVTSQYEDEEPTSSRNEYAAKDLSGLAVAHDLNQEMVEGAELVLTLKDKDVLDDDEADELENSALRDKDRLRQTLENRSRKTPYGASLDDDEQVTMGGGNAAGKFKKRSVLAHYDEVIDEGKRGKGKYVLGEDGVKRLAADEDNEEVSPEDLLRAKAMSLDYEKQREVQDFKSADEITIKKSKKKKKSKLRSRTPTHDDDNDADAMQLDSPVTNRDRDPDSFAAADMFVDDDDLQSVLAAARRKAVKRRAAAAPPTLDQVARDLAEHEAAVKSEPGATDQDQDQEGGLVFDETSEFARVLDTEGILAAAAVKSEPGVADIKLEPTHQVGSEDEDEDEDDMDMDMDMDVDMNPDQDVDSDSESSPSHPSSSHNPLADEPALDTMGLGSALEFFRLRGALDAPDHDRLQREHEYKAREAWDATNASAPSGAGKAALKRRAETQIERLKDYKPDVRIEYHDAQGRQLSTKGAFKELSHKFHGRRPGKNKMEKMMRKEEEKRRQMNMASGDKASELASAMMERQKLLGTAGIQLTEGNRPVSAGPTLASASAAAAGAPPKSNKRARHP
ncbi:SART-1 protein [Catenaria anguillulae PL171]|uniref:SART-1 protein n=1 Tax=Catenaria anguillulae PL171 TaxID=765915 RepID=A0A1Y2HJT4_9FUNG|nr:SART-1 protein [Catenaria anguillulae PL171]